MGEILLDLFGDLSGSFVHLKFLTWDLSPILDVDQNTCGSGEKHNGVGVS
jgi:hypothetical protein